jgi:hypothetical protein
MRLSALTYFFLRLVAVRARPMYVTWLSLSPPRISKGLSTVDVSMITHMANCLSSST